MLKIAYRHGVDFALKEAGISDALAKHPRLAEILGGAAFGAAVGGPVAYATDPEKGFADAVLLGSLMGTGAGVIGAQGKLPMTMGSMGGYGAYRLIKKLQGD